MHFNIKQLIICFSIFVCFNLNAQVDFSLKVGAGLGFSKSKTFSAVQDSYNSLNSITLKNNLSTGINKAYTVELNAQFDNLFMGVGLSSFRNTANAKFTNDAERNFDFKHNYYNVLIGISKEKAGGNLILASGICVTDYFLMSYVKYPTGDIDYSYGSLQGTYHTNGFGVPLMIEYTKILGAKPNLSFYSRCQIQAISATKFSLFNIALEQTSAIYEGIEILDDTKRILFEIGLKYNL